jgi:8-oxo-dGTP pyrophosphatase MutT (NUDIX family)
MTATETFRLPDFSCGSDYAGAIIGCADSVFLLRNLGHRGVYYGLPGSAVSAGETPESACARGAHDMLRAAISELANQLGEEVAPEDQPRISIVRRIAGHPWCGVTYHYFLVSGLGTSPLLDPQYHPEINRDPHQMGVWYPFEWVPIDRLSNINLQPMEAIGMIRQGLSNP